MPGTLLETAFSTIRCAIQTVKFDVQYRINVADVPRQRPSTPEEETIDRAVERMAPAWLDREEGQGGFSQEKGRPTLFLVRHLLAEDVSL